MPIRHLSRASHRPAATQSLLGLPPQKSALAECDFKIIQVLQKVIIINVINKKVLSIRMLEYLYFRVNLPEAY